MANPAELVVVRSFTHPHEAYLACSALHAAGLDAAVADEHIVQVDWLTSNYVGGVKVLVRRDDAQEAHDVLHERTIIEKDNAAEYGDFESDPPVSCPRCGNDVVVRAARRAWIAILTWYAVGVPLFPIPRRRHCDSCRLVLPD
jgi:hypothetical protein